MVLEGGPKRERFCKRSIGQTTIERFANSLTVNVLGLECVRLKAPDGAGAVITCYGAQVVSWIPAGGEERMFLSSKSAQDRHGPIRGGVPVVFPQFASSGPLPHHGLVRTREWRVIDSGGGGGSARFRVEDSAETRALWPHAFACELSVTVSGARLDLELRVENTGPQPFDFTAALHTYLRVAAIQAVRLEGLHGARYRDKTQDFKEVVERAKSLTISGEVDRIYIDAPGPLVLREPSRSLSIHARGFPDVVVWNPWKQRCAQLQDMPKDGYEHMLCVEAAAVVVYDTPICVDRCSTP